VIRLLRSSLYFVFKLTILSYVHKFRSFILIFILTHFFLYSDYATVILAGCFSALAIATQLYSCLHYSEWLLYSKVIVVAYWLGFCTFLTTNSNSTFSSISFDFDFSKLFNFY
jgi:hypothetical protein